MNGFSNTLQANQGKMPSGGCGFAVMTGLIQLKRLPVSGSLFVFTEQ